MWGDLPVVDGHLDLAENVTLFGRDLTLTAHERRAVEDAAMDRATVSLPDLERGGIAVVCATVTAGFLAADVGGDFEPTSAIYHRQEEAEAQALAQIDLYEQWQQGGRVRILRSAADLEHHLTLWQEDRKPGLVLLMEGADPIVHTRDLSDWWNRGLRMIGLTYGDTVYGRGVAGGSSAFKRGGLTAKGRTLLDLMAEQGFIWDVSHLTGDGVREGLEGGFRRVCASHANARALTPTDRHVSDETIRAIAARDGVIGLVLYNRFLQPGWTRSNPTAVTLGRDVRRHAEHVARVGGWEHIGLGSDLDGGFGLEASPEEIDTVADLWKIGQVVPSEAREGVLGGNWLRFFRWALPQ